MTKRIGLWMVGLCLMITIGFSQAPGIPMPLPPGPEGAESALPPDPMRMNPDELMTCANALLQQGDTHAAMNLLTICHGRSLQQHTDRFNVLLNTLLAAGNLPEAERVYQENMAQHDRMTRDYINVLHQYFVRQGNDQVLLDWIAGLQTMALPQDLRAQAFGWRFDVSRSVGPLSRVIDLIPVCVSNFDAAMSRNLLTGVINAYDDAGDLAAVAGVLDAIDRVAGQRPDLRLLVTCRRVNLLFSSARWPEAEAGFMKEAPALPDAELSACFQHARTRAIQAMQFELSDRLCEWVLKEQQAKPGVWQAAARAWLDNAKIRKTLKDIPVRLEALKKMGCDNNTLVSLFEDYGGLVITDGKPDDQRALLKFGEPLTATITDKREKEYFRIMIAEIYFMLEDYDRTLHLFKAPLSFMEPDQQAIIINKLKAHQALKKGKKKEAIKGFRAYMETVKTWSYPETYPYTDMVFTKEMCLGLNCKRIGDIYSSMKDDKQAQLTYQEADDYYALAQKEFKADSKENEYIKARRDELAKVLKK